MKKIILVRHGRAEDDSPDFPDFERSLTLKGKNVSRLVARKLKETVKDLGVIISSPAFRAIETALIFAGEFGVKAETIVVNSDLYYLNDEKSFTEILKKIDEDATTITLFGHNPSFTELASHFCIEACDVIPKSGIVCLSFKAKTWSEVKPNTGNPDLILKPKKIL
jgi:phosphohistidine phosphatase